MFHFPGGCRSSLYKFSQFVSVSLAAGFHPLVPGMRVTTGALCWHVSPEARRQQISRSRFFYFFFSVLQIQILDIFHSASSTAQIW